MASQSLFSYRTGILLDAEWAPLAFDAFLSAWTSQSDAHAVLEWPGLRLDSILAREMRDATHRLGHAWNVTGSRLVPCVFPEIVSEDYLHRQWSKSRRKTFRRDRKRLEETGPVSLRLVRDPAEIGPALETFLRLEQDSWKGDEGTACVSNSRDAAFIRDMIHRLAHRNHVVMSELRAGEHVVASAINFVTGPKLHAFKIGWDKNFAAASPGALHEAELLLASQTELRDFSIFDSCATEDSYIAPIWPERIPVGIALIVLAPHRNWNWLMLNAGRTLKRLVKPSR